MPHSELPSNGLGQPNIPVNCGENNVLPFARAKFDSFTKEIIEEVLRAPIYETQSLRFPFSVTLCNGPIDRVVVRFHESTIEYFAPAEFPNAERREFFTNRWLSTRPLFAKVKEMYPTLTGACLLWLDDLAQGPGLCFSSGGVSQVCIPDAVFLETVGYKDLRAYLANNRKPWISRSPTIFWRGASTGYRTSTWRDIQRLKLCLESQKLRDFNFFDVGIVQIVQIWDKKDQSEIIASDILRASCPTLTFMDYKYSIDVDGNSCSWPGLFTKLLMGNTVIKIDSVRGFRQWYYNDLIPWENFVPISNSPTASELLDIARWLHRNEKQAEDIATSGKDLAEALTFDNVMRDISPIIARQVVLMENALAENSFASVQPA